HGNRRAGDALRRARRHRLRAARDATRGREAGDRRRPADARAVPEGAPLVRTRAGARMLALLAILGAGMSPPSAAAPTPAPTPVDAAALYNSGTEALRRGDLGAAVAFLAAARRIDPRASDLRANLAVARSRVQEHAGS